MTLHLHTPDHTPSPVTHSRPNRGGPRCVLLLMLLALTLLVSACGSVEMQTTIAANGSGVRRYAIALEETTYDALVAAGNDPFADLRTQAQQLGFTAEFYHERNNAILDIGIPFPDLETLSTGLGAGDFEQIRVERSGWPLRPTFAFQAEIAADHFPWRYASSWGQDGMIEAVYRLSLPGAVIEHNADEVRNGVLIWHLSNAQDAVYDLYAVSQTDNTPLFLLGGAGLCGLLLLIVVTVTFLSVRSRRAAALSSSFTAI